MERDDRAALASFVVGAIRSRRCRRYARRRGRASRACETTRGRRRGASDRWRRTHRRWRDCGDAAWRAGRVGRAHRVASRLSRRFTFACRSAIAIACSGSRRRRPSSESRRGRAFAFGVRRSVSPRGEGPAFGEKVRARMLSALEQSGGAWLPTILPDAAPPDVAREARDLPRAARRRRRAARGSSRLSSAAARRDTVRARGRHRERASCDALIAQGWRPARLGVHDPSLRDRRHRRRCRLPQPAHASPESRLMADDCLFCRIVPTGDSGAARLLDGRALRRLSRHQSAGADARCRRSARTRSIAQRSERRGDARSTLARGK